MSNHGRFSPASRVMGCVFISAALLLQPAYARDFRVAMLPNGNTFGCLNCHVGSGGGPRNAFGLEVNKLVTPGGRQVFWSAALAALDSDGDGVTNGEELADPDGDGKPSTTFPSSRVGNPGDASSKPNFPPEIALTFPTEGATFSALTTLRFAANASDGDGLRAVEFNATSGTNSVKIGPDSGAPFVFPGRLSAGSWKITAKATDTKGLSSTSSVVNIVVEAPSSLVMGNATPNAEGTSVNLDWSGGLGPFVIQSTADVASSRWQNSDAIPGPSTSLPIESDAEFFRVVDLAAAGKIPLSVYLTGDSELPTPVVTPATGFGLLYIDGTELTFDAKASQLSGEVTGAHLHGPASPTENNSVIVDLVPFGVGNLAQSATLSGSVTLDATTRAHILNGRTYMNFHTPNHRAGEIRGQVAPVAWTSSLSGAQEKPEPVATEGTGSANFLLIGNELTFNISYKNLSGPAAAAHIHGPAGPNESASVLVDLIDFKVGELGTSGAFAGKVTLPQAALTAFIGGKTYLNVHTPSHGRGEIRGQILPRLTATPFTAYLDGTTESPAITNSTARGSAILLLEDKSLALEAAYLDLSAAASAGHIHGPASSTNSASVLIGIEDLAAGGLSTSGGIGGLLTLDDSQRSAITSGLTYLNFHTPNNPKGEIRGQVAPVLTSALLNGANEKPTAVVTTGFGQGSFMLAHQRLAVFVTYQNMSTNGNLAHIHGPASVNASGNVLIDLEDLNGGSFGTSGTLMGFKTITASQIGLINDGLTYVNVHTPLNARGELRGQLVR